MPPHAAASAALAVCRRDAGWRTAVFAALVDLLRGIAGIGAPYSVDAGRHAPCRLAQKGGKPVGATSGRPQIRLRFVGCCRLRNGKRATTGRPQTRLHLDNCHRGENGKRATIGRPQTRIRPDGCRRAPRKAGRAGLDICARDLYNNLVKVKLPQRRTP